MLNYDAFAYLPSSEELPDSDETPVDNELQDLVPSLLKMTLALVWSERWDWFFGVDMGIYYNPNLPAIVPDGFLSLSIPRVLKEALRPSYVLWEERQLPILVLEVVSPTYRGEYTFKKELYRQELGILYYVVYNPFRKRKAHLEVYKLVNREYILIAGNPVWLPEIGLGIGRERGTHQGITREWLYWYNEQGQKYLIPDERIQEAEQRAQEAEQRIQEMEQRAQEAEQQNLVAERRAQILAEMLRNLGINPEHLG